MGRSRCFDVDHYRVSICGGFKVPFQVRDFKGSGAEVSPRYHQKKQQVECFFDKLGNLHGVDRSDRLSNERGDRTMQVKQVLQNFLTRTCQEMHKARRVALGVTVMAALRGQRLTATGLGRAIDGKAKEKHRIKRADRLLSNPHLQAERETIYHALSRVLVGAQRRPVILVDWSDMDPRGCHFLLRASVPVQGRAMTLYEEVHTVEGKLKPKVERRFLATLKRLLPADCRPIVVTDAGFRNPWFTAVEKLGWDWIGRVRHRTYVALAGHAFQPGKSLHSQATTTPKALGEAHLARSNPITCQLVLYKAKAKGRTQRNRAGKRARTSHSVQQAQSQREPWMLATSLPHSATLAKRVVHLYRTRMHIEEAFRDIKSPRFGLSIEWHFTNRVERLQMLLLIAALTVFVAWLLGKSIELLQQHRHYQANTVRSRNVLSTVFLGLRVVHDAYAIITASSVREAYGELRLIIDSHCDAYITE